MPHQTRHGTDIGGGTKPEHKKPEHKKPEEKPSQAVGQQDDRGAARSPNRTSNRPRDAEGRFIERRRSDAQQPREFERRSGGTTGGR